MLRSSLVMTALVLLAAPSAQAGWLDRDVSVTVAPEIPGDRMSYATQVSDAVREMDGRSTSFAAPQGSARVLHVEGAMTATDAYGIARDAIAYRSDVTSEGMTYATRCFRLAGGLDTIRIDILGEVSPLDGPEAAQKQAPARSMTSPEAFPATRFTDTPCLPGLALVGRELGEGDVLPLSVFEPSATEILSTPATATSFQERAALTFTFAVPEGGMLAFTIADGLPGIVEAIRSAPSDAGEYRETTTLVGYEPGVGIALAAPGDASLPARHPEASFSAPEPLAFDDASFGLAFRYADAYAAIVVDPATRFNEWLAGHPDAVLALAHYSTGAREPGPLSLETKGTWTLGFASGAQMRTFTVSRIEGAATPVGPLATPTKTDRVMSQQEGTTDPVALPAEIADAESLAALVTAQGVDARALSSLAYALGPDFAFLDVASPSADGTMQNAILDPTRGATTAVYVMAKPQQGGLLGFFEGGTRAPAKSGLAALDAPTAIAAGGVATAGALVLLLFLLPLFTRLRKDRLLDNPIRARLYERVRAEPGIHRAELVDFAGIGEGATRHHLGQLAKHRLLVETHVDGFVRYFAAGEVPPEFARRESVLRAGSHRAVYDLYAREPGLSLRDAGERLGMSAPSVHRAKKKLETAGLLPAALDTSNAVAEA